MKGYLVVLSVPVRLSPLNPLYRGLDRGPGWPNPFPEEEQAIDAYVFGNHMSDMEGGLIPTEDLARELLDRFSSSPRRFEMIYAETLDEDCQHPPYPVLGYDVAAVLAFWSVVGDWPAHRRFAEFAKSLNEYGLFPVPQQAERFIERFREVYPEKHQTPLYVFRIHSVTTSSG